jgi:hypothetical protein
MLDVFGTSWDDLTLRRVADFLAEQEETGGFELNRPDTAGP